MKLRFSSITVQILLIVLISFIIMQGFSAVISTRILYRIVDETQERHYSQKIDVIIQDIEFEKERHRLRNENNLNSLEVREDVLSEIKNIYYSDNQSSVYPFITDTDYKIVLHRSKKPGERICPENFSKFPKEDGCLFTLSECELMKEVWCVSKFYEPFGWYIIFPVPLEEKFRDINKYKSKMSVSVISMGIVFLFIVVLIMNRFTRPIIRLTRISREIAEGRLDQPIDIHQKNEVGILSESFENMRVSISEKIDSLNVEITDRKRAEEEAGRLEEFLTNIIDAMPSVLICVDSEMTVLRWNQSVADKMNIPVAEACGKDLINVFPFFIPFIGEIKISIQKNRIYKEKNIPDYEGETRKFYNLTIYPLTVENGPGAVIRLDDVTREFQMERQLYQKEKLESVGQLAGGVAHDFNNMLAGILGAAEIIQLQLGGNEKAQKFSNSIINTCEKASVLIENLLAFSSEQEMEISLVDIHKAVENSFLLLNHTIDPRITIKTDLTAKHSRIFGDMAQLENVFINLGINASHAINSGGEISVETSNIEISSEDIAGNLIDLQPGEYIKIDFKDTGSGIEEKNINKIFEPFFTTKQQGEGSGLGLASVYGAVSRHKGIINVFSEIEQGTVFTLYFPIVKDRSSIELTPSEQVIFGTGKILVIDDDYSVRGMIEEMLISLGYSVLTAKDGTEGVEIYKRHYAEIDLVILDMIMPDISGEECFEQIISVNTQAKILLSSGYSTGENVREMKDKGLAGVLSKPYRRADLSRIISEIINSEG